jgi:NTP pyrophosphatase (non-canonical NTP hydrolase)
MEFVALIDRQLDADRRRGFAVDFPTTEQRQDQLSRELVGLVGEIGEFANVLKKVTLRSEHPAYEGPTLEQASAQLGEELADALIYIIRLSAILGSDLEADLVAKMKFNDARYGGLG